MYVGVEEREGERERTDGEVAADASQGSPSKLWKTCDQSEVGTLGGGCDVPWCGLHGLGFRV